MIKFCIVERGYEYNDEGYYAEEGGTPKRIFDTEVEAKKHARKLNEQAKDTHDYLYENREYDEDPTDNELIEVYYVVPVEY